MTVRVNKPSLNIREKLSELERPIGLKGGEIMSAETAQEARDLVSAGRKNMIINGSMLVNQRGHTGALTDSVSTFIVDRFKVRSTATNGGVLSSQGSASAASNAPGFRGWLQVDVNTSQSSLGTNDYARIQHYVEGYNCFMDWGLYGANTDHVTISFWVKAHLPGVYCVSLEDGDASPIHIKEYIIKNSGVWQKISVTFPPPRTGSFRTRDNQAGLRITWCLAAGTGHQTSSPNTWNNTYNMATSNIVNFYSSTDNYFNLTGVQLEVGKNATDFEYRSYGEELALCQRYYQKMGDTATNEIVLGGYSVDGSVIYNSVQLPVEMRAVPTLSRVGTFYVVRTNQPSSLNSHVGRKGFGVVFTTTGTGNYLLATSTNAYFVLDAEI